MPTLTRSADSTPKRMNPHGPRDGEPSEGSSARAARALRWTTALAAASTAASAAGGAEASTIQHIVFDQSVDNSSFDVDLDGDGHVDFIFSHDSRSWDPGWGYNPSAFESNLAFKAADQQSGVLSDVFRFPGGWIPTMAMNLTLDDPIGADPAEGDFRSVDYAGRLDYRYWYYVGGYCGYGCYGGTISESRNWGGWVQTNTVGYVGFEFTVAGATHYGWAQIANWRPNDGGMTLIDAAWETTPGQEIAAGQVVPEPSTLSLLALGFTGVAAARARARRKREAKAE